MTPNLTSLSSRRILVEVNIRRNAVYQNKDVISRQITPTSISAVRGLRGRRTATVFNRPAAAREIEHIRRATFPTDELVRFGVVIKTRRVRVEDIPATGLEDLVRIILKARFI